MAASSTASYGFWCLLAITLALAALSSPTDAACKGFPPFIDNSVNFSCKDDFWQTSNTSIVVNQLAVFTGPTLVTGNFTLTNGSILMVVPPDLDATVPLLSIKGSLIFVDSFMIANLTHDLAASTIDYPKQGEGWIYLYSIDAYSFENITTLQAIPQVDWPYAIMMNLNEAGPNGGPGVYIKVPEGHVGLQLGIQAGSPLGPQPWFPALLSIVGICGLVVLISSFLRQARGKSIDKKAAHQNGSINGDDNAMVTLERDD